MNVVESVVDRASSVGGNVVSLSLRQIICEL